MTLNDLILLMKNQKNFFYMIMKNIEIMIFFYELHTPILLIILLEIFIFFLYRNEQLNKFN